MPILADGTLNWRAFMWWTNCWHVGDALRLLTPVIFVPLLLRSILKRVTFWHLGSSFIVGPSNEAKAINDYIGARLQSRNRGLRKVDFMILAKTKKNLKFFRLQNLYIINYQKNNTRLKCEFNRFYIFLCYDYVQKLFSSLVLELFIGFLFSQSFFTIWGGKEVIFPTWCVASLIQMCLNFKSSALISEPGLIQFPVLT